MTESPNNRIMDVAMTLSHIANDLALLARAFSRTGNQTVADDLLHSCEALFESIPVLHDAVNESTLTSVRTAQSNSFNVLKAVMAGASVKDPKMRKAVSEMFPSLAEED